MTTGSRRIRRSICGVRYRRRLDYDEVPLRDDPSAPAPQPRVSVVIAAYGRPSVVVHAVRSALRQSVADLEVLVVLDGEGGGEARAAALRELDDPRIRLLALRTTSGDQSGPNSVGMHAARGRFIAFLNQDDMWFPDHLERGLAAAAAARADLVLTPCFRVRAQPDGATSPAPGSIELTSTTRRYRRSELHQFLASGQLLSADLVSAVGDWKPATAVRYSSSQDFVYRCWAAGARLTVQPLPTVVAFPSVATAGAYAADRDWEQRLLAPRILAGDRRVVDDALGAGSVPGRRARIAAVLTRRQYLGAEPSGPSAVSTAAATALFVLAVGPLSRVGIAPFELLAMLRGLRAGETNWILRRSRGLAP